MDLPDRADCQVQRLLRVPNGPPLPRPHNSDSRVPRKEQRLTKTDRPNPAIGFSWVSIALTG